MNSRRLKRLNSLLKEVISEVINQDVRNPSLSKLFSITKVEISPDLHQAKVYVSVIGEQTDKNKTLEVLNSAAGYIGVQASKKVTIRFFPTLTFSIDNTVDEHMKIEKILQDIHKEQNARKKSSDN